MKAPTKQYIRFNSQATTHEEARQYYRNRAIYFLFDGWALDNLEDKPWGVIADFSKGPVKAKSAYVFATHTGQGHYTNWLKEYDGLVFSNPECHEAWSYLQRHCITRLVTSKTPLSNPSYSEEYSEISKFYKGKVAKRSGLPYINHIDEGLWILKDYCKATPDVIAGYCLHPLVQNNSDLLQTCKDKTILQYCKHKAIIYAMEYRRVANSYLSFHGERKQNEIELSPLVQVNLMLIADKVQNRKDFENYLRGKVSNSDALDKYFKAWLERLQVTEEHYQELAHTIQLRTGRKHRPL